MDTSSSKYCYKVCLHKRVHEKTLEIDVHDLCQNKCMLEMLFNKTKCLSPHIEPHTPLTKPRQMRPMQLEKLSQIGRLKEQINGLVSIIQVLTQPFTNCERKWRLRKMNARITII